MMPEDQQSDVDVPYAESTLASWLMQPSFKELLPKGRDQTSKGAAKGSMGPE